MRDPILFGDFRMALNEGEPRIYEDIQAYDVAKNLFQVVCFSLELCVIFVSLHEAKNGQEIAPNKVKSVCMCTHTTVCTEDSHLASGIMKIGGQLWQCFLIIYFP